MRRLKYLCIKRLLVFPYFEIILSYLTTKYPPVLNNEGQKTKSGNVAASKLINE
jgi:hypothetical protein